MIAEGDLIKGILKAADGSFETETAFPFARIKSGYQSQFIGKKKGDMMEFPIEEAFEAEEIKYVTNTFREKDRTFSGMFSLEISGTAPQETVMQAEDHETVLSDKVILSNPAGLHARPAAVLATIAKKFKSDIRLIRGDDTANAKSLVAIMGLSTRQHDEIVVQARGSDAPQAAAEVAKMLADGYGEKPGKASTIAAADIPPHLQNRKMRENVVPAPS